MESYGKLADTIQYCNREWLRNFRLDNAIEEGDSDSIVAAVRILTRSPGFPCQHINFGLLMKYLLQKSDPDSLDALAKLYWYGAGPGSKLVTQNKEKGLAWYKSAHNRYQAETGKSSVHLERKINKKESLNQPS